MFNKKYILALALLILLSGFTFYTNEEETIAFDINDLYNYQKEFECEEIDICSSNDVKTYMDYRLTSDTSSVQYRFIRNNLYVDNTGFLYDKDGFIAVALGSYYGNIGDRYYFTLDSGIVIPVVKAESKADGDVYGGCYQRYDGSVIEFLIDTDKAQAYFGTYANGYVLQGNYNNYDLFHGYIDKVEKVVGGKISDSVSYWSANKTPDKKESFNYASGY
ncbi:MAG: hypothetical protein KBT35_04080 [Firmicutes bacterium]|nr:hypothetical protein [Candidatus Colivicinus equi]